jgi:hypothetical protein
VTKEHYQEIENSKYTHVKSFILGLMGAGIGLEWIDTNDFLSCPKPRIYIHGKNYRFSMRGYVRLSNYDLLNAIRFYNSN